MVDPARITQQYVEAAISEDSEPRYARVTNQYVEVALISLKKIETLAATHITAYSVQLNGQIDTLNPGSQDPATTSVSVYFEYSEDDTFATSETTTPTTLTEITSFNTFVTVEFTKFYYFRAVVTDGTTTWYGETETFLATDYYYQETGITFNSGTLIDVELVSDNLQLTTGSLIGSRTTPELDISSLNAVSDSFIDWDYVVPTGTSIVVEIRVSEDSGSNWSNWEVIADESIVFALFAISDFTNAKIQFKQTLNTDDALVTPTLSEFEVFVADGILVPPIFDPEGGNDYYANQYIELFCPTIDSTIYYTIDGSTPDNTSTEYTTPILIENGLTIKAVSSIANPEDITNPVIYSPVVTHTYNTIPFPASEISTLYAYRFRNDDGTESTATWIGDENEDLSVVANTALRMRLGFSGQEDLGAQNLQLEYRFKPVGGSFSDWKEVQ